MNALTHSRMQSFVIAIKRSRFREIPLVFPGVPWCSLDSTRPTRTTHVTRTTHITRTTHATRATRITRGEGIKILWDRWAIWTGGPSGPRFAIEIPEPSYETQNPPGNIGDTKKRPFAVTTHLTPRSGLW